MNTILTGSQISQRLDAVNLNATRLALRLGISHVTVRRAMAGENVGQKYLQAITSAITHEERRLMAHLLPLQADGDEAESETK